MRRLLTAFVFIVLAASQALAQEIPDLLTRPVSLVRDSSGGLVPVFVTSELEQGPLTPAGNLRVRTDANGYLVTTLGAYTAPLGPLTPFSNLRLRTDSSGALLVTSGSTGWQLANATTITWTNFAGSGTVNGIGVTASDIVAIGDTDAAGVQVFFGAHSVLFDAANSDIYPAVTNTILLGAPSQMWAAVYATSVGTNAIATQTNLITLSDTDGVPAIIVNPDGAPTPSSCGDGALATGSSNSAGRLNATNATACTLTFSVSFGGNGTSCTITNLVGSRGFISAISSTAVTVSGLTSGDDFTYICVGY